MKLCVSSPVGKTFSVAGRPLGYMCLSHMVTEGIAFTFTSLNEVYKCSHTFILTSSDSAVL